MYGHIQKLAEAEKAGIEAAGGKADLYQSARPSLMILELASPRKEGTAID